MFSWLHWAGGLVLIALLVAHVGAAIWHHKVKRDDTLIRMMPGRSRLTALSVMAMLVATAPDLHAGSADAWTIETDTSRVGFTARQMNVPVNGTFNAYTAAINFDPGNLDEASIKLEFETASISTGNPQADQALPGAEWFAAAEHPSAKFEATQFKPAGKEAYEVAGTLTIKGNSAPVVVMATISTAANPENPLELVAKATGEATVSRTAFKVGEGQWANTATIADEVVISFTLNARRAK